MADVLNATTAVTGLLEIAIRILRRFRKALERQKDAARLFDSHTRELEDTKTIIQIVEDEDTLQTANVASQLVQLKDVQSRLVNWLKKAEPGTKGPIYQLSHQLFHGSKEEKQLVGIMNELSRAKMDLCLGIQLSSVGVMKNIKNELVANHEVINRINSTLVDMLGQEGGLKIAQLLKGRSPRSDGTVLLSESDLTILNNDDKRNPIGSSARIIVNNLTTHQAIQINGPVGEDMWKDISHLEIKNNKAEHASLQLNYATSLSTLKFLMNCQEDRLKQERIWKKEMMIKKPRKDSFMD